MFGELSIPWLGDAGWGVGLLFCLLTVFFTGALFCLYSITFDMGLHVMLDRLWSGFGCCPYERGPPEVILSLIPRCLSLQ